MLVRKLFVLTSVIALDGLVAMVACGGTEADVSPAVAPAPDAGSDAPSRYDEGGLCKPIDATKFPYAKARAIAGACTTKELEALSAHFKSKVDAKEDALITAWAQVVSEGCASCVFSDGTGAEWTPILTKGDRIGEVNGGGCLELASGSEACGGAYHQAQKCRAEACTRGCSIDDFNCGDERAIFASTCKGASDALAAACGPDLATYEMGCKGNAWTFEGPITVQCITGGSSELDAGKDAN